LGDVKDVLGVPKVIVLIVSAGIVDVVVVMLQIFIVDTRDDGGVSRGTEKKMMST
jgi:hypothetical protein